MILQRVVHTHYHDCPRRLKASDKCSDNLCSYFTWYLNHHTAHRSSEQPLTPVCQAICSYHCGLTSLKKTPLKICSSIYTKREPVMSLPLWLYLSYKACSVTAFYSMQILQQFRHEKVGITKHVYSKCPHYVVQYMYMYVETSQKQRSGDHQILLIHNNNNIIDRL